MRAFVAAVVSIAFALPAQAGSQRFFDDAALRSVQFVDGNEGWAVGDEGAIWHTIDGGKTWERQPTGTRASLRAVHFLNPFTGWVAGREELPEGGSTGVVLVTTDGGLKWQRVGTNVLPGLHCVRFFDDQFGIVAGDGSDQYPSGVFSTTDGGKSWKPLAGPRCPGWLAADFHDAQVGVLAGSWSRLATLREGKLGAADVDTLGGRSVRGVKLLGKQAVAVGEGGLVLVSASSTGSRWGFADLKLPREVEACLDFDAVACHGDNLWVVGRPGSVVLHSADRGNNWKLLPTGQNVPLHGAYFLSAERGWAVGELGTILTTADGGQTWTTQRQGGQRAAVLCVHGNSANVPLATVALLGCDEGYLVSALRVACAEPGSSSPARASDGQRLTSALRLADGAAAESLWQFPLAAHATSLSKTELLDAWGKLHGDKTPDELLRQIVLALRIWQPEVVLTDRSQGAGATALDELMAEAVEEGCKRAADPRAFPEQLEHLGLKPWTVKKLYRRSDNVQTAKIALDLRKVQPRLRATAQEYTAEATDILTLGMGVRLTDAAFDLAASSLEGAAGHRHLMQGIVLAPGGTARRNLEPLDEPDPDEEKAVQKARSLQQLVENPAGPFADPNKLLAQVGPALAALPENQAAPAAFAIANQFARSGQWVMAREVYLMLADRYPAHPLSREAYRWLIRHNCSSEARRRHELGQFLLQTDTRIQQSPQQTPNETGVVRGQSVAEQNKQLAVLRDLTEVRRWYEGALALEPRLLAFGPVFGGEPSLQFCLQAARRQLGQFEPARQWYGKFQEQQPEGPWRSAALAEHWLLNRQGQPPKPAALCRTTTSRPYLDGNFDDECWKDAQPLKLRNAIGQTEAEYATEAWLACDRDFLYLALRCKHPAERHVVPVKVRQRDADLREHDRVSLLLDLDRDYNTYFRLSVDQRGCLHEDCWGDPTWNPRWFVAVRSEPSGWQVEAAIPLNELTGEPLSAGRGWACNVVRVLPGRGVQAWSAPADVEPRPEGMGLLLFTGEAQKQTASSPAAQPPRGN
ncbi:MAG: hypothetical protein JNM56_17435 [Planctomycetia bacterium]|nr:hypothetical protein [Planctomycetia bacterium]